MVILFLLTALSSLVSVQTMLEKSQNYAKSVSISEMILTDGNSESDVRKKRTPNIGQLMDAEAKEFPHMAEIGYGERNRIKWLCGGSLISQRFVLSVAHCTYGAGNIGMAEWVRLGKLDTLTNPDDASPIIIGIIDRYNHPDYMPNVLYNDIALYKLERNVEFSPYIHPICLRTSQSIPEKIAMATGWMRNEFGEMSNHLQKIRLNLVSTERCNVSYHMKFGQQLRKGIVEDSMLCAGITEDINVCQGCSGCPLQIPVNTHNCMLELIGVTSFGKTCNSKEYPDVYARVSYFLPWIQSIVSP